MSIEAQKETPERMVSVRVSEASRADARWKPGEVEFVIDEYERLIQKKKDIEMELSRDFGKGREAKERLQTFTRARGRNPHEVWAVRRTELEVERAAVLKRKHEVEARLAILKDKYKLAVRLTKTGHEVPAFQRILGELQAIKSVVDRLEAKLDK